MNIRDFQKAVHANAVEKGFYDKVSQSPTEILSRLMLAVSELSEAGEEVRKGYVMLTYVSTDGKPEGFATELADAVIRILDLAEWIGVDIESACENKHAFNLTRPHMHGKKT
jgi:NTP pyrophosphatase (non-canonical NTP hydrolase)